MKHDFPTVIDKVTHRTRVDLVGRKFGRWKVLAYSGRRGIMSVWKCRCDCGKVKEDVLYNCLVSGNSNSCGCLRTEQLKAAATHGRSKTRIYTAWQQMKDRCLNVSRAAWRHYGGRGIKIHPAWIDSFETFAADIAHLGEPPYRAKFDRIDNDGNYEPGNVRWADDFISNKNRRGVQWQLWKGQYHSMTDIARMENVAFCSFRNKVYIMGMTLEESVADCRARGLTYKERAKGKRPDVVGVDSVPAGG